MRSRGVFVVAVAVVLSGCGGKTSATDDAVVDLAACSGPGTCGYVPTTCCGACNPTLGDVESVATIHAAERHAQICGGGTPVGCAKCSFFPPPLDLLPLCQKGRCATIDVHVSDLSACETDADCTFRDRTCCESCAPSPYELIALAKSRLAELTPLICPSDSSCPPCVPTYPGGVGVVCDVTKHCALTGILP